VILIYGAIGRYNFGDLIFPHVVNNVIQSCKSIDRDVQFCDILSRDMTSHGGMNVRSVFDFVDSDQEVDVIHVGGETGSCSIDNAVHMFQPQSSHYHEMKRLNEYKKRYNLAYLLPKTIFKNPGRFVTNCIGGTSAEMFNILKDYDFLSTRDLISYNNYNNSGLDRVKFAPDSAVVIRKMFNSKIQNRKKNNITLNRFLTQVDFNYIAVQVSESIINKNRNSLKKELRCIIEHTNIPIIFFCAGTAPFHDSMQLYRDAFGDTLPKDMIYYFDSYNIWDVCALISSAKYVIGTSMHVRILASVYERRRMTIIGEDKKHGEFIQHWDDKKNMRKRVNGICNVIQKELSDKHTRDDTKIRNNLEDSYMKVAGEWLSVVC
jgi:hypothetical protein